MAISAEFSSRINPAAFTGVISVFLAVAILAAFVRTYLRIRRSQSLDVDDGFLILAVITLITGTTINFVVRDNLYDEVNASLDATSHPSYPGQMHSVKLDEAASVMIWTTIYAVKFSFVFLFRKLIRRVRSIWIWWWIVFIILIPAACISIIMVFVSCSVFLSEFDNVCNAFLMRNQTAYLYTTVGIDVLTDILVISIPVALLWKVHISLRRKLALGAILCLSVFMVVIAIIRAALAILPQRTTDTVWIFFWQTIEAATAVIMASVTTMFSLFGQEIASRNSKRKSPQVDMVDARGGYDTLPTNPLIAPTAPEPTLPKSNTFVACGKKGLRNDEFSLEVVSGRGIRVTHDISTTQQPNPIERLGHTKAPSASSFV